MISVPTLLVGLGGIGSKVVDHVYGMIPSDMRSSVAVHAFDTNVNDISKLVHLGRERVTQTSTKWTVREYLDYADDSVKYWFPHEIPEIKKNPHRRGRTDPRNLAVGLPGGHGKGAASCHRGADQRPAQGKSGRQG